MLVDTQTAAPHRAAHIVWDWNGTLLHDTDVVVESVNACLAVFEAGPITVERYRDEYCVPIPRFYQRLLGRELSGPEWERLDGAFQRHYAQHAGRAALTEGATDLLLSWQRAGHTQSLCSLALHDQLTPLVTRLGIAGHFTRVDGSTGEGNRTGKAEQMARHLAALGSVPRSAPSSSATPLTTRWPPGTSGRTPCCIQADRTAAAASNAPGPPSWTASRTRSPWQPSWRHERRRVARRAVRPDPALYCDFVHTVLIRSSHRGR